MPVVPPLHPVVEAVTERIRQRSAGSRGTYLERVRAARDLPQRAGVSCTNLAHVAAGAPRDDQLAIRVQRQPHLAIVSAYNEMLSAHQPLGRFPEILRYGARGAGATAQFAGGVPAMCDGVTQGQPGMELSLWSRDVIAQATAVALSHNVFDGALLLGVCDKIVPGLLIGALGFGHLPCLLVPAGPMPTGLGNEDKARMRQLHAEGRASREQLLEAESRAYHGPGTCTFYGTANTNQFLMEIMGLHVPGTAFVPPGTELRTALTALAARRCAQLTALGGDWRPIGQLVDERAIVNAIVGLLATGGSTNHTIHLVAIARAAGIAINWDDFDALSAVVPLLARVYPNGRADVNEFHAAGGIGFVIRELLAAGLAHDLPTVWEGGLAAYTREPYLDEGVLAWRELPAASGDPDTLRGAADPFSRDGGLRLMTGNLGRAIVKTSAVRPEHQVVVAPARVFHEQEDVVRAFKAGELDRDVVVVVRFQGPRANGMPELHKVTPSLGVLQDRGHRVALVTDGRMSGASGKVLAAIHVSPEAALDGPLARVRDGDLIRVDAPTGRLELESAEAFDARPAAARDPQAHAYGLGRELFAAQRARAAPPEEGAVTWLA